MIELVDPSFNEVNMIYDRLANSSIYSDLNPRIKTAFDFLNNTNLENFTPGRYELEGDTVYVLVQEYEPKPVDQGKWEAHHRYVDVQYMLHGCERIDFALLDHMQLGEYNPEKDSQALNGQGQHLLLEEGSFVVFFPQDAHMPGLSLGKPEKVKKIVLKCLL